MDELVRRTKMEQTFQRNTLANVRMTDVRMCGLSEPGFYTILSIDVIIISRRGHREKEFVLHYYR
jgi:hypothetical protein